VQNSAPQSLSRRAFAATAKFLVVLGLLIFLPAGSIYYWQGWLFWSNFALWCVAFTPYFLKHDPALLERRLRAGPAAEREPTQKRIQLFASIFVCALFVVSALDYRMGWSTVPVGVVLIGNILVAAGFWFVFVVFRENSFASSIIEVGADQKVIDTGPYAVLRHPMYAGALLMFAGVPPALGSWWGLVTLLPIAAVLAIRLIDEEKFLVRNLPGYAEYRTKVRYRLLPGVW
jgi:protein-S-isoprenylcysteine O-methyltransferase Ste14